MFEKKSIGMRSKSPGGGSSSPGSPSNSAFSPGDSKALYASSEASKKKSDKYVLKHADDELKKKWQIQALMQTGDVRLLQKFVAANPDAFDMQGGSRAAIQDANAMNNINNNNQASALKTTRSVSAQKLPTDAERSTVGFAGAKRSYGGDSTHD